MLNDNLDDLISDKVGFPVKRVPERVTMTGAKLKGFNSFVKIEENYYNLAHVVSVRPARDYDVKEIRLTNLERDFNDDSEINSIVETTVGSDYSSLTVEEVMKLIQPED